MLVKGAPDALELHLNHSGSYTGIFWEYEVNTIVADALAPCQDISGHGIDYTG